MPTYYIIENNKIVNAILADTKQIAESVTGLVAIDSEAPSVVNATIGAKFDVTTNTYITPPMEK